MENVQKSFLNFLNFTDLENWSSYSLLGKNLNYTQKFPFAKIGSFLKRNKTPIDIIDGHLYKRAKIKINGQGIFLRDIKDGKEIGTKKQFLISKGQFLLSKIDARNGAFGVVPQELDGAIITGNFWTFDVDYSLVNPFYLTLLTGTKEFQKLSQTASVGTTNRNYLQEIDFLNFKVPLPSLQEQQEIVEAYFTKINEAHQLEVDANNIDQEIEKYFLNQLGLKELNLKEKQKGLLTVHFKDLDRWDYFSGDYSVISQLKSSHYSLSKLGDIYSFAKRSFNKKGYPSPTFKYIEIGAIDTTKGILEVKEVKIDTAPSRATQIVKKGDLILGLTRPYLKKFALVTQEYDDNICSSGFSIIEESKEYYLPYLLQFLKCSYGIEQLKNRMTGGLYPAITEGELKEIKIPLPDIDKQIEIMNSVNIKVNEIVNNKVVIEELKRKANEEFEKAIFQ
ncbi:restriction endonuclease subunit S [Empedobacter falsenii]